jgi:hypothetical protein
MPFSPAGEGFRVFARAETSGEAVRIPEIPLVGLGSPSEFHKHQAAPAFGLRQRCWKPASLEVSFPYSVSPRASAVS